MYCIIVKTELKPDIVYLQYIHSSESALAQHKETAHYLKSRSVVNDLIARRSVIRTDVTAMNPSRLS